MRDLLLVGASGLAREVLAVLARLGTHRVLGILDDDVARHGTALAGVPVLGGLGVVEEHRGADLLLCVGAGSGRRRLRDRLVARGGDGPWATLVHPSVDVPASASVGAGSVLLAHVALTAEVRVGQHVVVMPNVTLTHDDVVEDYATLAAGVSLGGGVLVGEGAYLGMNASVRERVRIGPDAVLGMGAALLRDLPEGETWAGVPARALVPTGRPRDGAGRGSDAHDDKEVTT